MANFRKIAALIIAVVFFAAILSSVFYIAAETEHDCAGDNCPVCYQLAICETLVRTLSVVLSAFIICLSQQLFSAEHDRYHYISWNKSTLITLNIKLSD